MSPSLPAPQRMEPHHDGSPLYLSHPAPPLGSRFRVRVRVPDELGVEKVIVRTVADGEAHYVTAARSDIPGVPESWWTAELTARNLVTPYRFLLATADEQWWLTGAGLHAREVTDSFDFRVTSHPASPEWAADAVAYQVFPDRFARSQHAIPLGDLPDWAVPAAWDEPMDVSTRAARDTRLYGGDLDGVTEHLDHVAGLGANLLYLTPVFPARSNHRYDATTFDQVDPILGGDEALRRLQEAAHARGMRVMGDITTNHTGVTHEWFVAAMDPERPEAGFYLRDESDPTGWATWQGVPTLPKLNHASDELARRLFQAPDSSVRRWLGPGRGLDAWRIDVANMTGRYAADDLTHDVARRMRAAVSATEPDALLVAEHYFDHADDITGDGWHGVMNYAGFTRPVWTWLMDATQLGGRFLELPMRMPRRDGAAVVTVMREFLAKVPWTARLASFNLVDSHDTARIETLVAGDAGRVEAALALMVGLPGIPMVCYGDEVGIPGTFGEDGRRPMPWDAAPDGVAPDPGRWDAERHATYRQLLTLRRQSVALRRGGLRWLHVGEDLLVALREHPEECALVVVARSEHAGAVLSSDHLPGVASAVTRYGAPLAVDGRDVAVAPGAAGASIHTWLGEGGQW